MSLKIRGLVIISFLKLIILNLIQPIIVMNPIIENIQKIVSTSETLLADIKNLQEYKNYIQDLADELRVENRELREANTRLATELFETKLRIKQYEDDLGETPAEIDIAEHALRG